MVRRIVRQRLLFLCAILLTLLKCAMALWMPMLTAEAIDNAIVFHNLEQIFSLGIRMLAVALVMGIASYGSNMSSAVIGQRLALGLREQAYKKVNELTVAQATNLGLGSLITRLTVDIDVCANLVNALLLLFVEPATLMLGGIVMMWRIAPELGLVFFGFVAVQLVVMLVFVCNTAPGFVRVRRMNDMLNLRLQNSFSSFRLTKALNTQSQEEERVGANNLALFEASLSVQRKIAFFNPLVMLIMNLAVACVLVISGYEVATGLVHVGMVLSAINYSEQVLLSIASVGHMYRVVTETQPSAARIREVLEMQPDMVDGSAGSIGEFASLELDHIGFSYAKGGRVFNDVSLTIRAGESVAVVGPIGCGKTTLASLCNRLYDVTSGCIMLNGKDIRSWGIADVRRTVALVEKQTSVLDDTVFENIVFGREGIREDDVKRAVEVAQFEPVVNRKLNGLQTPLYAMGKSLSGGERQRLTIARALAGQPGLLILDDSTSSLDYVTEAQLLRSIKEQYPKMAVMIITNRLMSALRADRIVVISQGMVDSVGTDEELQETSVLYRKMCAIQEGAA